MCVSLSITLLLTLYKLLTLVYTRLLDFSLVYITRFCVSVSFYLKDEEPPNLLRWGKIQRGSRSLVRLFFSSFSTLLHRFLVWLYKLGYWNRPHLFNRSYNVYVEKETMSGGDLYKANRKLGLIWKWAALIGKPQINFGSTNFAVGSFSLPLVCAPLTSHFSRFWALSKC